MNKTVKRCSLFLLLGLMLCPQVGAIETSRHIARIIEQLPCELPQGGTFTCSRLNIGRQLYVERRGDAVTQVGVRLFAPSLRESFDEVVCNAVERLWLELVLCKDLSAQKKLMKEHRFSIVYNGFTLGTTQFPSLSEALHLFTPNATVSMNAAEGKIVLRLRNDEDALVVTLPADRELLYAYDKKEHEDVIKEELAGWTRNCRTQASPFLDELEDCGNDLWVLPGRVYMIDSLKSETYYTVVNGRANPVFSDEYPMESLHNLCLGCFPAAKVDLHVRYRTYERDKVYCSMPLTRFLGYMQHQGVDFYAASYNTGDGAAQCLLLMHHPIYDYIHMLIVNCPTSLFEDRHTVLEGDFYTFIPQHNIKSLFNF